VSERKSAEIKFRCTPSFKSGAQAAADAAGQSLTEFIESAVWQMQNISTRIDGTVLTRPLDPESEQVLALDHATHTAESIEEHAARLKAEGYVPAWAVETQACEDCGKIDCQGGDLAPAPEGCTCRPWEFCTHKASA
jgi:uncharacterized protein (DUF1778 family)